ncbi:ATP-dependent DNA helicase Q5 [Colletotrichum higginsianum]|uniref:ATP-dependent DNA helicase Q5 n=2 Tax=Colletotrichum higginsianum TaxID=80884 RepID=A0A4T0VBZ6_9PEZI|nr:ATP-dependent DNA helicase Q5 [Colletotrichum higginsianum]
MILGAQGSMQTACGSDGSGLRADTKAAVDRYVRWWGALGKGQFYCCDEDHSKVLRATHKGGLGAAKGGQNIQEVRDSRFRTRDKGGRGMPSDLDEHDVHVQPDEVGPLAAYLAAEVAQVPVEDLDGRALEGLPGLDVSLGRPRMDLRSTRGKRQPTAAVVQRCFCLLCYPDESLWAWKDGMSGEEMQAHLAASHPRETFPCGCPDRGCRCEGAKYRTIHLQKVLESTRVGGSNLPSKFVRVDAPETVDPPAAEPATEGAGQQGAAAAAADEEAAWRALRDRCRVVQPTVVFGDTAAAVDVPYRFATLLGMDTHFLNGVDLAAFQKLKARREMPGDHAVVALFLANFDVLGAAYFRGIALLHQDHKRDMGKIAGRSSGGAAKAKGAFPMQDSTIVSYLENWREVLVYLLRRFLIHTRKMTYDAGHLPRIDWSTQETQLPLEISTTIMPTVFPRRSVLDAFIDLVCFAEARLETPAADAGAAGWLDKLLTVSLALSEDIVAGDKFACALVGATAASCTRADGVKHPTVASKGISGIIACVKATFVAWSHRESALWSTGADWDFAYTMFARPYFAYFSTRPGALTSRPGSYVPITALACLYECRNVGIEESFNTAGLTTTALRDGGQTAIHGANSELNIHDFRAANGQQIARLHRCLVDLLLLDAAGLPEQASVPAMQAFIDNDVPFPDITDDWTDRESGTSAYTQTFGKDGPPLLLDRVWDGDRRRAWTTPDRVSGGVRFRQDATAAYFRQVHAFLGDLLVTAFLLAGVQSRGTEFLTMRHTNTPQHGQRNLFWFGNMCQWGAEIRYHKGDNDTEAGDSAWHFFPPHLSYVISYYLLYVQPFTQVLIQEMAGGATVDHSPFLCGTAPDAQRSRVLAGEIRRMMDRVPPSDLMQALAGCSGAARAAVAQEEMGDDYADDDGDESRLDGEYAYDKADPSNARLGHCWPRRPGGEDDGDMLGQLETLCRTLRGLARDSAMADAVDAGDGGSLAGITIGSGTGLVTSLWETAAPQQVPPRRASAGPSDFSPGFWNNRKFYIELARFFERRLGTKIGIASLRHIMEIWARHLTEGLREDAASLSTVQGMTDCLLGAMHEQAGHSDRTAAIKYALSQPFLHWGRGREKIGRHARASMVMHAFLLSDDMVGRPMTPTLLTRLSESPNDLGAEADAGRLRALLTSRDAVVQMNRLCAGDRAVNDQPLAFLQACCGVGGHGASFKPAQEGALRFAYDGRPLSVVVLPTGGGKTIVAFAGARLPGRGVTLLVVPFANLLEAMRRRAAAAGILALTSEQLSAREAAFHHGTKMLICTPEALHTASSSPSDFAAIVQRLVDEHLLDRVVLDEYHNLLVSMFQDFRRPFLHILHRLAAVPRWIVLTATLPPTHETFLVKTLRLARDGYYRPIEAAKEATLLPAPHDAGLDPPDGRGPQRHVDAVFRASVERSNLSYRVRTYRALHDLVDSLACEITTRNTVTGHLPRPPKTIVLLFMDVASATVVADGLGRVLVCAAHHYKGDRRRQDAVRQALQEYEDAPDAYATATATAPAGRVAPEMAAAWRLEDVPCLVGTSVIGESQDVGADAVICVQGFPIGATTLDQGFGRGARDGRPGTATCFYKQGDADDALIAPARHAGADVTADEVGMAETRESKAVVAQFLSTSQCRRVPLATYFNWASRRTRCDSLTGDLLCDLCEDRKNDGAAADTADAEGAGRATPARPTVHRAPPTPPADPAGPRRKLPAGWQQTGGGADRRKRVRRLDRDDAAARPKKAPPQTMTPSQEAHRHHRLPGDETSARGPRSHTLAPASSRAVRKPESATLQVDYGNPPWDATEEPDNGDGNDDNDDDDDNIVYSRARTHARIRCAGPMQPLAQAATGSSNLRRMQPSSEVVQRSGSKLQAYNDLPYIEMLYGEEAFCIVCRVLQGCIADGHMSDECSLLEQDVGSGVKLKGALRKVLEAMKDKSVKMPNATCWKCCRPQPGPGAEDPLPRYICRGMVRGAFVCRSPGTEYHDRSRDYRGADGAGRYPSLGVAFCLLLLLQDRKRTAGVLRMLGAPTSFVACFDVGSEAAAAAAGQTGQSLDWWQDPSRLRDVVRARVRSGEGNEWKELLQRKGLCTRRNCELALFVLFVAHSLGLRARDGNRVRRWEDVVAARNSSPPLSSQMHQPVVRQREQQDAGHDWAF